MTNIFEVLTSQPHNEHYLTRYYRFIQKCQENSGSNTLYYEVHHICPRSMFPSLENDDNNLIKLTAREHYIAHWMLWKAYNNKSMSYAFMMMHISNDLQQRQYNSKIYQDVREDYSTKQKSAQLGKKNTFYGKKHTQQSKDKMSKTKKSLNLIPWNKGLTKETSQLLKETSDKISKARKGVPSKRKGVKQKPLTPEQKLRHKESLKNSCKWWTNGTDNIRSPECPKGYRRGRTMSPSHMKALNN